MSEPFVAFVQPLYGYMPVSCHADQMIFYGVNVARGYMHGCYAGRCNCYIDDSRNQLVKVFLQPEFNHVTHLFWADQDMTYPWALDEDKPDTMRNLLAADKDVVGGVYFGKDAKATIVAWESLEPALRMSDFDVNGLQKVAGIGMGCTLVKTSVYRQMAFKYGDELWYKSAGCGEDYWFCRRCQEMGVEIWMDGRIQCGHTTETSSTYEVWKQVNNKHLEKGRI